MHDLMTFGLHADGIDPTQGMPSFDINPVDHSIHIHIDSNPADDIVMPDPSTGSGSGTDTFPIPLDPSTTPVVDPTTDPTPAAAPHSGSPANGDAVVGDPNGEARFWFHQNGDSTCASSSIADVVNQFTGSHLNDLDVVQVAQQYGIDAQHGMSSLTQVQTVLGAYGIQSHLETGSISDLEQMLNDGHRILVGVDSEAYWHNAPDQGNVDHCVTVTGIDETKGVVYLNDSGANGSDGKEEEVPLKDFQSAWAANSNEMVVTDGAIPADHGSSSLLPSPSSLLPSPASLVSPSAIDPLNVGGPSIIGDVANAPTAILGFILHLAESVGKAL